MHIKVTDAVRFPGVGAYGIPELRSDMLADLSDAPTIETWAGKPTQDSQADFIFHNWRNAGEAGLPWERTILGFYQDDFKFDQCYNTPQAFLKKMLYDNPLCAVTPNYSMWFSDPPAMKIWATYRARWCGRYWQEHGFHVIPDVNFCDEASLAFCCDGIPEGAPLVSMQVQTAKLNQAELDAKRAMITACLARLRPAKVMLYGCRRLQEFAYAISQFSEVIPIQSQLETARKFKRI